MQTAGFLMTRLYLSLIFSEKKKTFKGKKKQQHDFKPFILTLACNQPVCPPVFYNWTSKTLLTFSKLGQLKNDFVIAIVHRDLEGKQCVSYFPLKVNYLFFLVILAGCM